MDKAQVKPGANGWSYHMREFVQFLGVALQFIGLLFILRFICEALGYSRTAVLFYGVYAVRIAFDARRDKSAVALVSLIVYTGLLLIMAYLQWPYYMETRGPSVAQGFQLAVDRWRTFLTVPLP